MEKEKTIQEQVGKLNISFYQLLYDLKENKEALGKPEFYNCMLQKLFDLYKQEYERIYFKYEVGVKREVFEDKARGHYMIPHRSWFFGLRNKSAKLIDERIDIEVNRFFEESDALIDAMRKEDLRKSGVNDLSEQAASRNVAKAPPADLPITTLQACDELVNFASPPPQKPQKQGQQGADHKSDEIHKSPKTGKKHKEKIECKK